MALFVSSQFEVYLGPVITVHPERLHHTVPHQPPGIALAHQPGLGGRGAVMQQLFGLYIEVIIIVKDINPYVALSDHCFIRV